jgi:short-subunit dehydrogenase
MNHSFADKRCVVTGAGSGIGRAIARDLASRQAILALSDIDEDGLGETRNMIGAADNRHRYDTLDVANRNAVNAYAADLAANWGAADYLFNVAGLSRVGEFTATPADAYDRVMAVNFKGLVDMTRAFTPQLLETKGGVVNISSIFGMIGVPGQAHYCASKFAVRGFSESLAQELAPHGVAVTSVHPGGVATNIARNAEIDALPPGTASAEKFVNRFEKAARTSPEKAARVILSGAAKRKRRVMVGADAHGLSAIQRLFPTGYQWLIAKAVRRE